MQVSRSIVGQVVAIIIVFIMITLATGAGAVNMGPMEQIRETVDRILTIMRDESFSAPEKKEERRNVIMAEVEKRFDFREMSKRTLARNWKERTAAEQEEFQKLFSELLKNTYIGRVEAYSDEQVVYPKVLLDEKSGDRAVVYSNVVKNNQEIPINYKLYLNNGEWFVYDVDIEGVSLVRNYRTEFTRVISKEKYPGLIRRIKEKLEKNEEARQ
ncbi:MAG: ABC transporter substrate-binding protein [Proteobacteria bacterium]|nr:ABC transporter substrate-binding protein [Pseudomonadota bacterium]MBU1736771.1 ABC transporter substrate-binding protein [Pseudomonadota bacterium]